MNRGLIWFGMICMVLGLMISFLLLATSSRFVLVAYGQTEDQNTTNFNELMYYEQIIGAFIHSCTTAIQNHDTATVAVCVQVENQYHDALKPFVDINKDIMMRVILGP